MSRSNSWGGDVLAVAIVCFLLMFVGGFAAVGTLYWWGPSEAERKRARESHDRYDYKDKDAKYYDDYGGGSKAYDDYDYGTMKESYDYDEPAMKEVYPDDSYDSKDGYKDF